MDNVSGVDVKVVVHQHGEQLRDGMSEERSQGYDTGCAQGWSEAALEALANVYDRYRDLGWAKELIFPGIDPDDDLSVLVDELMDEYVRECGDEPEQRKSAYEETPYSLGKRGEDAAVRYLKANKVRQLDVVVATHPHRDHVGGLDTVVQNFPVKTLYTPVTESDNAY